MKKDNRKFLLVLTNNDGRQKFGIDTIISIDQKIVTENLVTIVRGDNEDINSIKKFINAEDISKVDFLAYHNKGINKDGLKKDDFKDPLFSGGVIKGFSHDKDYSFPNNFYNVVLPKVYGADEGGRPTLKDIIPYFPSTLSLGLDFVHRVEIEKKWDKNDDSKYNEVSKVEHFREVKERCGSSDYDSLCVSQYFVDEVIKIQFTNG